MRRIEYPLGLVLLLVYLQSVTTAQEPTRIDPAGIPGAIVFSGSQPSEEVIASLFSLARENDGHVVVLGDGEKDATHATLKKVFAAWANSTDQELRLIHVTEDTNVDSIASSLETASGLWIVGTSSNDSHIAFRDAGLRSATRALIARGGTLGLIGTHPSYITGNIQTKPDDSEFAQTTLDMFPNVVIDTTSVAIDFDANVTALLQEHPSLVGFELDPTAGMIIRRRHVVGIGEGSVRVKLAETANKPAQSFMLEDRTQVMDLVALRKAAFDRVGEKFPPDNPEPPFVPNGSLIIIGGGGMPEGIIDDFVARAGGEEASIIVLPTAMPDPLPENDRIATAFQRAGAKEVNVLTGRTLDVVESEEYIELFSRATGIWFGGGRQWRFVDAYYGTKVHDLMHDVLARGGVIMGSSAGASIQAEYMARGTPIDNVDIMADGYERGLGFLPGAAVDQHFKQRGRFKDMTQLIGRYPQLLGIGIDEATAIVVSKEKAEVVGRGAVHFYDSGREREEGDPDYVSVYKNGTYDLVERKILNEGDKPEANTNSDENARTPTRPPRPPVTQEERVGRIVAALMERLDKNGDGIIDEDERKANAGPVELPDPNEDGKVTPAELSVWLHEQMERRQRRRD